MNDSGGFGREDFLRLVDFRTAKCFQPGNFIERQAREDFQEAADIGIFRVAPVLPEIIGAEDIFVEPDRAGGRFAHLGTRTGGQKRRRQGIELRRSHAVSEIDAVDDVAPLVRTAHLQHAAMAAVELDEIVTLHDHVVEFEEGEGLLPVQPQLDAVE